MTDARYTLMALGMRNLAGDIRRDAFHGCTNPNYVAITLEGWADELDAPPWAPDDAGAPSSALPNAGRDAGGA